MGETCGDKKSACDGIGAETIRLPVWLLSSLLSLSHHPHASYAGGIITLLAAHKTHSAYVDRPKKAALHCKTNNPQCRRVRQKSA
jgi:hypothetical protein